ncbi:Uncharacterized protein At5g01610 [Linum grandiflorum]
MDSYAIWTLLFAAALFSTAASTFSLNGIDDTKLTAYEVLQQYNFPVGILPKGITGYEIDRETGKFKAYLPQTCKFSIQSYQLEYGTTISGVISKGRISNLKGVKVHVLFLWLNIVEVVHDDGQMQFSVGITSADFPLDGFDESPQCGCGFDCNGLVSSL